MNATIITPRSERLKIFCPLWVSGLPGNIPCNFAKAIKLPVVVSEPKSTSKPMAPIVNLLRLAPCKVF